MKNVLIERLRAELIVTGMRESFTSERTLKISKMLDRHIVDVVKESYLSANK